MSFSFGFSNEDLEGEEIQAGTETVGTQPEQFQDPLAHFAVELKNLPQELDFASILKSLVGNRFTFNSIDIEDVRLFRRELFDIKHQLMLEEDAGDEEFQILIGDTNEDLKNQVYEGGLKSWECSVDAVRCLKGSVGSLASVKNAESEHNIVELGCGTSLPSLYLFISKLQQPATCNCNFIMTDFNKSVLRLVTVPNLLINWAQKLLSQEELVSLQRTSNDETPIVDDELEITLPLVERFYQDLQSRHLHFRLISGSWCSQFLDVLNLQPHIPSLVISSETIYSPVILPVVSEIILQIIKRDTNGENVALVTAKDIYFGVGGSVNEFLAYLDTRKRAGLSLSVDVTKLDSHLKRSVIVIK